MEVRPAQANVGRHLPVRRHVAARRSRVTPAIVPGLLALAVLLLVPSPATAFELPGCELLLTSLAADGKLVDTASSGSMDATQDDPLLVAWDGTVEWQLVSAAAARSTAGVDGWSVQVFGVPTLLGGSGDRVDTAAGSVGVGGSAPFRMTGLFYVSGSARSGGATACEGGGWLKVLGSPAGTVPFFVGLAVAVFGAVLAAAGARGRVLLGVAGGLLAAIGLALLGIIFGFLPLGAATPAVLLACGLGLGLLAGWWGRLNGHGARVQGGAPSVRT
jgi:hypothetical protein